MKYNVDVWTMIQMTLTRIVKVLEFTGMITQTSWIQNIVIDTIKESSQDKSSIFYYASSTNIYKIDLTNILQNTYAICLSHSYTRFA